MHISRYWLCLCNMASKPSRTTNFSGQEERLLAKSGRDFPEVESNGYNSKTLAKKTKAQEEILTNFNSQNLNGIKRDLSQLQGWWRQLKLQSKKKLDLHRREERKTGGGKAPVSSSEVSELVADVIPASVNPLEQEFDNDAGEELDLRRDKDEMEVITCEVGPSLLADVQAISRKGKIIRSTIIFNRFKFFVMTITVIYHQMKLH